MVDRVRRHSSRRYSLVSEKKGILSSDYWRQSGDDTLYPYCPIEIELDLSTVIATDHIDIDRGT